MQIQIYDHLTQNQVNAYGLVLSSQGVPHFIRQTDRGWQIWVEISHAAHAHELITQYLSENQPAPGPSTPETPEYKDAHIGVWISLVLIACHLRANVFAPFDQVVSQYGASASAILNGQIHRTVTALMLHSDYVHLAGNVAGICIFGEAVGRIVGAGVGVLMILIAGILGNYANAVLFEYNHLSVGASTSVFGAVGITAAYQFYNKLREGAPRLKAWLPLAGGLALLAFLGAGQRTDLTAHLFGFMAGVILGVGYALWRGHLQHQYIQIACAVICVLILAWAWL